MFNVKMSSNQTSGAVFFLIELINPSLTIKVFVDVLAKKGSKYSDLFHFKHGQNLLRLND